MNAKEIHVETGKGWNAVARTKYREEFEQRMAFLQAGGQSLLDVEIDEIAPLVRGASIVHLQCSHGLDTISLIGLGAASVAGVDISSEMIEQARELSRRLGRPSRWYCADAVNPPTELDGTADLVYTGKGSLPWIMDLPDWAAAVARVLKPGGVVYVFEGHPLDNLWDRESADLKLREDTVGYFDNVARENAGFPASAVKRVHPSGAAEMLERFWRPDEVMAALSGAGLVHSSYREHPDMYWDQFPRWTASMRGRLPHSYSLKYSRPRQ